MHKLFLSAVAVAALAVATPAAATIIQVDQSAIQGENVLFNNGVQTNTTVNGFTNQSGTQVNFTGATLNGDNILRVQGGQARLEGANSGLTGLNFSLAGGALFNDVEFNIFRGSGNNAGTATEVDFFITDNEGQVFQFLDLALGNGENFFGFQGILGETIANVSFTLNGTVLDVRQVRLNDAQAAPVPGPIAGAGIPALMALGGFVWARRRKAAATA